MTFAVYVCITWFQAKLMASDRSIRNQMKLLRKKYSISTNRPDRFSRMASTNSPASIFGIRREKKALQRRRKKPYTRKRYGQCWFCDWATNWKTDNHYWCAERVWNKTTAEKKNQTHTKQNRKRTYLPAESAVRTKQRQMKRMNEIESPLK